MAGVSKEQIAKAREVDLLTYLEANEPFEIVNKGNGHYSTRTHDSMDISNGKWFRWSTGQGGTSALDYLVKVQGIPFIAAVQKINGQEIEVSPAFSVKEVKRQIERRLLLPKRSKDNNVVASYLMGRGIDYEIITDCVNKGLVFQAEPYNSVVFVGMDENKEPKYAAYRSTGKERNLGDVSGSNKEYSFRYMGNGSHEIHLFESAIDALSYLTLVKDDGAKWQSENCISMAGIFASGSKKIPAAIKRTLDDPSITRISIHFDNDMAGRAASRSLAATLTSLGKYEVIESPPPYGKDFNDFLCIKKTRSQRAEFVKESDGYER